MTDVSSRRGPRWAISSTLLLTIAACRSGESTIPVHPTSGRLLGPGGGPAAGATISFHAVGRALPLPFVPHGGVGKDGSFVLTSYARGDGAPEGDYDVTVAWRTTDSDGDPIGPDRLRGKYADPRNPLIRVTVHPGENRLEPFRMK